jgi:hypothetical protein
MKIMKYIIPQISRHDFLDMIKISLIGAVLGGIYGILHDQISFTISPEYFTKFKFNQFNYADFGLPDRIFVAEIGALATWWVGFFCVWFLARRLLPGQPKSHAHRQIILGFTLVGIFAVGAGLIGFLYGIWIDLPTEATHWARAFRTLNINQPENFIRVAYLHNASYLGGVFGLIVALLFIKPSAPKDDQNAAVA